MIDGSYILHQITLPESGPVDCPHRPDADAWGLCRVTRVRVVFVAGFPIPTTYDDSPWVAWQHSTAYGPQTTNVTGSGALSGDDYDAFMVAWTAGCPCADFNGDSFVTGLDLDEFMERFLAGEP